MGTSGIAGRTAAHADGLNWTSRMRTIAVAVASAMILSLLALFSPVLPAAQAAPGDSFDASRPTVFVAQSSTGGNTRLYRAETDGAGSFSFVPEGPTSGLLYNAIAWNEADGYIYGVVTGATGTFPRGAIVRIGQEGVVTRLGSSLVAGGSTPVMFVGGINPQNGRLYVTNGGAGEPVYSIDLSTGAVFLQTAMSIPRNIADWEYKDGYFWALSGTVMVRIDPAGGSAMFTDVVPESGTVGAAWTFGNGNLGFSNNASGNIYQVAITDPASAAPTFTVSGPTSGPSSANNDGTSIPGDPTDLEVVKEGPATFVPGGAVSYTLTVTNNGPGESSGWVLTDSVPANLSGVSVDSIANCEVSGNEVTCTGGRLTAGDSRTITVTGTTDVTERGCFVNTASVIANEFDPDETNNEDSAETCARLLEVAKTSSAGSSSAVGDTVEYEVTVTNPGAADYTASEPASFSDDLSGVLDDATWNDDATVSVSDGSTVSAPTLTGTTLDWEGPLAAGATATFTYSVTLTNTGDGTVANTACIPADQSADGPACADTQTLLPRLTIAKTSDTLDLPVDGGTVTYTIEVSNVGPGDAAGSNQATFTDDLSDVIDDGDVVPASITSDVGAAPTLSGATLTWSGDLAAGQTATISYDITYDAFKGGDNRLFNVACLPDDLAADPTDPCRNVSVPGAALQQWKTSDPASGTSLGAGDEVTYTLHFLNTGDTDADVDNSDDLSAVLDDAELTAGPTASDPSLSATTSGTSIQVTGTVAPGAQVEVTYTVSVLPYAEQGDHLLANALAECDEANQDRCTTEHPVRHLSLVKTSDAASDVAVGDTIQYELTITNDGAGDYTAGEPAVATDDLTDVLDDATWVGDESASTGSVAFTEPTLTWSGALASGASATVTYSVTLTNTGDGSVVNAACALNPGDEDSCDSTESLLPKLTVAKAADTTELPVDGGRVTYTVTVTNEGPGDAPNAAITDDLSDVVDDGAVDPGSLTADVGTPQLDAAQITWAGSLDVGEVATITYEVVYDANAGGTNQLVNVVCLPVELAQDPDDPCAQVSVPGAFLESWKTAEPADGTAVGAGDAVTYTLHFRNSGEAAATVDSTDDLSDVLDDADLTSGPTTSDPDLTATATASAVEVTGTVPVGETYTVSYAVTVRDYDAQGDHVLVNALSDCVPPDGESCQVENEIRHLSVTKSSSAGASSAVGSDVEYTVVVTNDGAADYTAGTPASMTDDLSDVLDDATWNGDETASSGTVAFASPTLSWSGALAAGDDVTITYSVTLTTSGDGAVANEACVPNPGEGPDCAQTETLLPKLTIAKTSDTVDLPVDGGTVTYTIEVTNQGPGDTTGANPASFEDDLSDVLDDAEFVDASLTADVGTAERTGSSLTWTGVLASGDTATIEYQVTYDALAGGTNQLVNVACLPDDLAEDTGDPCAEVSVPAALLQQWKTADPDSGTVMAGDEITYTLHFDSLGTAAADVDATDDLAAVLDDADVVSGPTSSTGALSAAVNGSTLSVTGSLDPQQSGTVTYTVLVREFADQGDHVLTNALSDCVPPAGESCDPIEHRVPHLTVDKSSDASTDARPGDTVTYTVDVQNTGTGDYTVDDLATLTDDLSGVLDDATWNDDATVTFSGVSTSASPQLVGDLLTWSGPLTAGETATLTYSVTLTNAGDGTVANLACVPNAGEDDTCSTTETLLPKLTIDKLADTAELPEDGGVVTYTVTVTNEGPGDATATAPGSFTDDLSDVLDDGDLVAGSITATAGTASLQGEELVWSGPLAAGESVEVQYQITYDATAGGSGRLVNVVCLPLELAFDPGDPCRTVGVPAAQLQQWKTADLPNGTAVDVGDEITYTLHFRNVGTAAATVDNTDDLSGVLDDADIVIEPATSDASLVPARNGETLRVTGTVAPGTEITVTYTAQVRAYADQGDHDLVNALAECDPDNLDRCSTEHPIRHLSIAKTSDASEVRTGDTVVYTVEVVNDGAADYDAASPAGMSDDLSDVLDDASWDGTLSATAGVAQFTTPLLRWGGELAVGDTVTITYSVTVTNDGDHALRNTACTSDPVDAECADVVTELPHVVAAKSSDPQSGASVETGDTIRYTLTWTNDGSAEGEVDSTDDLSDVLDDATVTSDPEADTAEVSAVIADEDLRITGPIAAGATVQVVYEVTVKSVTDRGNDRLVNVLVPDLPCGDECPPAVEHPVGELLAWKSVDPASGATLRPGASATYTLHFENIGTGDVSVDREDVLSGVLDDADLVVAPTASASSLTVGDVADARFAITGRLSAGQSETVTYRVTVRPDGERGDDQLGNALVPTGEDPPEECVPDGEYPTCTNNPVSNVVVRKSSDPESGAGVDPGTTVTYTITFANTSVNPAAAPVAVDYVDDLTGVLDDADVEAAPVADEGLTAERDGDTIRMVGAVPTGASLTVTYTATVRSYDQQGDHVLDNVVAAFGELPFCGDDSPLCTRHPLPEPPAMAQTGSTIPYPLIGIGLLMLLVGAAGVATSRRRARHS